MFDEFSTYFQELCQSQIWLMKLAEEEESMILSSPHNHYIAALLRDREDDTNEANRNK